MISQEEIDQAITRILALKVGENLEVPDGLVQAVQNVDFSKSREINIFSKTCYTEEFSGQSSEHESGHLFFEENGVLLGTMRTTVTGGYNSIEQGYTLYLLRGPRLALFSYTRRGSTSGRLSGLGYTGSEETTVVYEAKLEQCLDLMKGMPID